MSTQFDSILDDAELEMDRPGTATADLSPVPLMSRAGAAGTRAYRVLMVVESSGGGTGRHVLDLSEALIERGCDVHLIYSSRRTDRVFVDRLARISGLKHKIIPMHTALHPHDLAAAWAVRRYLRSNT